MRWLAALFILLMTVLPASAEDWTTVDGNTYKNVTVVEVGDDGVSISYTGGTAKIPYYNLPVAIQKRFGQDPDSLAAAKKAADDEDAASQAAALEAKKHQEELRKQQLDDAAQANALAAARAAIHLPPSLAASPGASASAFPGAEYSYNKVQDICYLDSPPANASPFPAPAVPDPLGGHSSLTLRIATDGSDPEHPDKIVATFLSVSTVKKLTDNHDVIFLVDGASIPIGETQKKDSDFVSGFGQVVEYVSFYLTPSEARSIANGKSVKFCVGTNNYTLDPSGISKLQKYLAVLDQLPPPSSSFGRKFTNFIRGLPSLSNFISQTCVDVVLSGFGIVVLLALCACALGASRFFKM